MLWLQESLCCYFVQTVSVVLTEGAALVAQHAASHAVHAQAMNAEHKAVIAIGTEHDHIIVTPWQAPRLVVQQQHSCQCICYQCVSNWRVDASCSIRTGQGNFAKRETHVLAKTQDDGVES